jgi:glucokinase
MRVLAGDIGGTKTLLAIVDVEGCHVRIIAEKRYPSSDYDDLASMVRDFLAEVHNMPTHACFGVAGPVVGGRSKVTKLPWVITETEIQEELGLHRVRLINDFVAVAYGIEALGPSDVEVLISAKPDPSGNIVVIGAGTGLGEAIVVQTPKQHIIVASEGGHADFAARNDLEIAFLRWMIDKYGRVSNDRVVSGPGIGDIYRFLRDSGRETETDALRRAIDEAGDPAPVLQRFADEENDPLSNATLDFFVSIYGAEAGNLALTAVATGGVYIAGGIAPRMIGRLKSGIFQEAFESKGRQASLVVSIPVSVVMNPKVGLLGAALAALADE